MRVTYLVSLCHPSGLPSRHVHQDLVVQAHPSVQVGQLLAHLFDRVDQASLVHQADHLVQAIQSHPVVHTEYDQSYPV